MTRPERIRLGDLLIQHRLISEEQLQFALGEQKRNGRKLGRVLVDNGYITEEKISEILAHQLDIPYVNLKTYALNAELARRLPENQARRFRALVLEDRKGALLVGMADPTDLLAVQELETSLSSRIDLAVVTEGRLLETIDRAYRRTNEISGLARELSEELAEDHVDFGALTESVSIEEAPVVRQLQALFSNAIQLGATDIHLEVQDGPIQVRFRIDGVLRKQAPIDAKQTAILPMRLKLMAGLDAAEKRLPQSGQFGAHVRGQAVDVRLSVLPAPHGDSLVLHLLTRAAGLMTLDQLDMPMDMLGHLRGLMQQGGMVLVCGPAGSGKTSTLYGLLAELNSAERKIVSVERLVERHLPGVVQVQVNGRTGLTFERALDAALQQDADVLMAGEMNDTATAGVALHAAMDGRLVFTAVHAFDAAGALFRLADMGVPDYQTACAVRAVLAKSLLRRVCEKCGKVHQPSAQEAAWLDQVGFAPEHRLSLRQGPGCAYCGNSGYSGRIGVYELLEMDRSVAEAVAQGDAHDVRMAAYGQMHGGTLLDHALALMGRGLTTVAEAMRLASRLG